MKGAAAHLQRLPGHLLPLKLKRVKSEGSA